MKDFLFYCGIVYAIFVVLREFSLAAYYKRKGA